jgi:DNA-binding transcriptional ArsR family regulator
MSRGPGLIERTILRLPTSHPMLVSQIARQAYSLPHAADVTPTHLQAVRRALRKLERAGVVARIYDEQLGRWRWQRVDLAAIERSEERQRRALTRRWKEEEREAAMRAANVSRLEQRPAATDQHTEERPHRPPRIRRDRRRSQQQGRVSIGQLWAFDVVATPEHELSGTIARITRLWAGLHEADQTLALELLAKLPKAKISH